MLTRALNLRFPIEIPGGTVSSVTVRSISTAGYELALTGPEGQLEAFAACVGLPTNVAAEMSQCDYDRVTATIASLARQQAEEALTERRAAFTVIAGGKQ
jgi:hypothetical protein